MGRGERVRLKWRGGGKGGKGREGKVEPERGRERWEGERG